MNLKSFFDLEKVTFSKEELEAPYENKPTDVIFIRENSSYEDKRFNKDNNPYENNPASPIFSKDNLH